MKIVKRVAGAMNSNAVLVVGLAATIVSGSAFAQASGATAGSINDSSIVSSITALVTNVEDIGAAVLAVVVCVYGYKLVKGFVGR